MSNYKRIALEYYNKGVICYQKGDLDRAITNWNEAIRHQPDFVEAFENRGALYRRQGKIDLALSNLDEAIRLQPARPSLYYNRALVHVDKKDVDAAIADYTQALTINPKHPDAHCNRGILYIHKGDIEKARADLTTALRINPQDTIARTHFQRLDQLATKEKKDSDLEQTLRTPQEVISILEQFFHTFFDKKQRPKIRIDKFEVITVEEKGSIATTAIALELSHKPGLVIWVMLATNQCTVMVLSGPNPPDYEEYLLGLQGTKVKQIPSDRNALVTCLNGLVTEGLLIPKGNGLRYGGPPQSV